MRHFFSRVYNKVSKKISGLFLILLYVFALIVFCKILFGERAYFPFKDVTYKVLRNKSYTVPGFLGDGWHVEVFELSNDQFMHIMNDKDSKAQWEKGPLTDKYKIDLYNYMLTYNIENMHDISERELWKNEHSYFYFEYIKTVDGNFDAASIWVYNTEIQRLYYIEASQ